MKQTAFGFWSLSLICVLASVQARAANPIAYEIVRAQTGNLQLRSITQAYTPGSWLGLTFHPPGKAPVHFSFPVKMGHAITEIEIDSAWKGGRFEAALWTARISREACAANDALCLDLGYRLVGMSAYVEGTVPTAQ